MIRFILSLTSRFPTGIFVILFLTISSLSSCRATYHADTLEDSIKRILKKEYNINTVQVKIVGRTLGVYLPLDKLFSANLDSFSSENANLEDLFRFHPEAMEKVEDVLFTTSRVILSTDRPVDFYVLKAVETKTTGIELILTGYVNDMKRVRFWDIAISEYRKRLLHDLSINRTVIWKRTIEEFFNDIGHYPSADLIDKFFTTGATIKDISPFFYSHLVEAEFKDNLQYEIQTLLTKPINDKEILIYVKVKETYAPRSGYEQYNFLFPHNGEHEFLFVLEAERLSYRIRQAIPFYYIDENRLVRQIEFPDELKIYDNIQTWNEEFELEEVFMGSFLAQQLTKRLQLLLSTDERIQRFFAIKNFELVYHEPDVVDADSSKEGGRYYTFLYDIRDPRGVRVGNINTLTGNQRTEYLYLWECILHEFTQVAYNYKFRDFNHLELQDEGSMRSMIIFPDVLERLRIKKVDINTVINTSL